MSDFYEPDGVRARGRIEKSLPCLNGIKLSASEVSERKKRRAYGRCISGITRSIALGYGIVRRSKWSVLRTRVPCLIFITLTSTDESIGSISVAWSSLLKRIRRKWQKFEYFKIRTDEGRKGVLHIIARNSEFIAKDWLTRNWSATFQATVTWSTQCYGKKRWLMSYLMGYLKHHESFRYGFSARWICARFKAKFSLIFSWKNPSPMSEKVACWENYLSKLPPDVYPVRGQTKLC